MRDSYWRPWWPVLLTAIILGVFLVTGLICGPCHGGPLKPWRPSGVATVDESTIKLGGTARVTYSGTDAKSCVRDIHWSAMFIGRTDGIPIPVSGWYDVTPTEAGTHVTTVTWYRRARDLNANGISDGRRRSFTVRIEIEVLPAEK